MKLYDRLVSMCKCDKKCRCWHCKFSKWVKNSFTKIKDLSSDIGRRSFVYVKGVGLVVLALMLLNCKSLEHVTGLFLLGWGILELIERWDENSF